MIGRELETRTEGFEGGRLITRALEWQHAARLVSLYRNKLQESISSKKRKSREDVSVAQAVLRLLEGLSRVDGYVLSDFHKIDSKRDGLCIYDADQASAELRNQVQEAYGLSQEDLQALIGQYSWEWRNAFVSPSFLGVDPEDLEGRAELKYFWERTEDGPMHHFPLKKNIQLKTRGDEVVVSFHPEPSDNFADPVYNLQVVVGRGVTKASISLAIGENHETERRIFMDSRVVKSLKMGLVRVLDWWGSDLRGYQKDARPSLLPIVQPFINK